MDHARQGRISFLVEFSEPAEKTWPPAQRQSGDSGRALNTADYGVARRLNVDATQFPGSIAEEPAGQGHEGCST